MRDRPLRVLLVALLLLNGSAQADGIYKWVDDQGNIHFGDRPPAASEPEQVTVRVNTYSGRPVVTTTDSSANTDKVVMYSAQWCGVCKRAKRWFAANDIPFTELDIDTSRSARRAFDRLGGKGVPIILVGNQRMDGFSPKKFSQMVGLTDR